MNEVYIQDMSLGPALGFVKDSRAGPATVADLTPEHAGLG